MSTLFSMLEEKGVSIAVIKEAFKRSGYRVSVKFYPWKRTLEIAKLGLSDGVGPVLYTKEREQWLVYSESLNLPLHMGCLKNNTDLIRINGYKNLKKHIIGYVMGYAYSQEFLDIIPHTTGISFYNPYEMVLALVSGKIDLAMLEKREGELILKSRFPKYRHMYQFVEPALEIRDQFLSLSNKTERHKEKIDAFNSGLNQIFEDGTFKRIIEKHIGK